MLEQQWLASERYFDLIGVFYVDLSDWQIYEFFNTKSGNLLSSGVYSALFEVSKL